MQQSTTLTIPLFPPPPKIVIRIANLSGQLQRQHVIDRSITSSFTTQADLHTIIHGRLTPTSSPATLIVAEFRFLSADTSRRFREASIELLFSSTGKSDPVVVAITPVGRNSLNPTREQRTTRSTAAASAESGVSGVPRLGATLGWELSRSFEREYCATVVGVARIVGRNEGGRNQARWDLVENPSAADGIPSLLRVAVLVKREGDEDFTATVGVKSKVDWKQSVVSKFQDLVGATPKDDPVIFRPGLEPVGEVPVGADVQNLAGWDLEGFSAVESVKEI